jgi:cobalt-zinc-cadmium efflux system protein
MGHGHPHLPAGDRAGVNRKLAISTAITLIFVVVEIGGALLANSLALLSDAFHNFTDSFALILALVALRIERRPPTAAKTFGYQRAGTLAAFVNAGLLVGMTIWLLVEAAERFRSPEEVSTFWMVVTSIAALAMNLFITLWLRKEGQKDLAVRSAVIHMMSDALSSVGIIIGAGVIYLTGLIIIDPIISVLIAGLILWSAWGILKEAVNLLLEGTPSGIDPERVAADIGEMPGVFGVHHLHIWAIGPSRPALSCHLMLGDVSLRSAGEVQARVGEMLAEKYSIAHMTIQVESAGCAIDDPYCVTHGDEGRGARDEGRGARDEEWRIVNDDEERDEGV